MVTENLFGDIITDLQVVVDDVGEVPETPWRPIGVKRVGAIECPRN
jgi:hypothetical protein